MTIVVISGQRVKYMYLQVVMFVHLLLYDIKKYIFTEIEKMI